MAAVILALSFGLAQAGSNKIVVELFTSQGCSSCPPADRYMGELAQRDDIIALTFHVDYWDYIGWRDTFATAETTGRQHAYGKALGQRYVYTPEMVIDGRNHKVGSDRLAVKMALREVAGQHSLAIGVSRDSNGKVMVSLPAGKGRADVLLVRYDRRHDVEVERGENAGKTLTYHNVVRDFRRIGRWDGRATSFSLDPADLRDGGRDGCAILVQADGTGPILGAVRIGLDS
jgi:hypothetical protein